MTAGEANYHGAVLKRAASVKNALSGAYMNLARLKSSL